MEQVQVRPQRGDELELAVESLAFGGAGVARLSGYVVFVDGGVPGHRVRAIVGKSKRAYAEARAVEVLEPSADRIAPRADHPGAPWQVLAYERQLEVKQAQVADALERIGHISGYELEPIVPAQDQWRYRNKLEYSFGAGPGGELVCGFHAPGSWEDIVRCWQDADVEGLQDRSVSEFMARVARRTFRETGVRVPHHDAELFVRASADAGLLQIVR